MSAVAELLARTGIDRKFYPCNLCDSGECAQLLLAHTRALALCRRNEEILLPLTSTIRAVGYQIG